MPFFKRGESSVEVSAYQLFEQGKTIIEVAQELGISPDRAREFHAAWNKMQNEQQTKAFAAFAAGKDLLAVTNDLGVRMEVVETLYRTYLGSRKRQEEIRREIEQQGEKDKKFISPYYVIKMIRNPYTGRGLTVEKAPMSFDDPPKSWTEFDGFCRINGDGEYIVQDAEGKRVSRLNVQGFGFNDPSEVDEEGYWGDGYHRGGMRERGHGQRSMRRAGPPGQQGMVPLSGDVDPYTQGLSPEDADAAKFMRQEDRRREVYYRVAEMSTNRGDADTAIKYLQMAEHNGKVPKEGGEGPKSFLDELINTASSKEKLDMLQKIFGKGGGDVEKEEDDPEIKKMRLMGELASDLIPKIRENIIDPTVEAISGEKTSVGELERSALGGSGKLRRGGSLGPTWRQQQMLQGRQTNERVAVAGDGVQEIHPQRNPQHISPANIKERLEIDKSFQKEQEAGQKVDGDKYLDGDDDEDFELKKAEDYGQTITPEELDDVVQKTKTEVVGDEPKLGIDEKYTINKLLPRFKDMIIMWGEAKKNNDEINEALMTPERIAREDYHTMTKSSYAMFIGKKRLVKSYKAAKEGVSGLMGKNMGYIRRKQEEALVNGMDVAAEKLRELGVAEFKNIWDPPEGMNFKVAIKELLRYIILKDCLTVFSSEVGNEWLDRYCKEFVKAVDEDYRNDDKRAKIRNMLQKGDPSKVVGPEAKPVPPPSSPTEQKIKIPVKPILVVKKSKESEENGMGKVEETSTGGTTETGGKSAVTATGNNANNGTNT